MPSLADLAPPELTAETVEIRGVELKVRAIDNDGWMRLHTRFPALRAILSGRSVPRVEEVEMQAGLIAAGLGKIDDPDTERLVLANLATEDQQRIMEVIFRLSLPGHVYGPLLNGAQDGRAEHYTEAPATK